MTGYRCRHLRHKCQDQGCYIDLLPAWDDLLACFPRNIRPTDVDGMVEINGHILILEEKTAGKSLVNGQLWALQALTTRPNTTVVVLRPGATSDLEVLVFGHNLPANGYQPVSRDWLMQWLRDWVTTAEAR